jgi:hypothetical protein
VGTIEHRLCLLRVRLLEFVVEYMCTVALAREKGRGVGHAARVTIRSGDLPRTGAIVPASLKEAGVASFGALERWRLNRSIAACSARLSFIFLFGRPRCQTRYIRYLATMQQGMYGYLYDGVQIAWAHNRKTSARSAIW